jgi:GNAT superfamily N-acetyltransferase
MTEVFTVRGARPDDYAESVPLLDAIDRLHWENVPWLLREMDGPARSREEFEELVAGPDSVVLVAEAQGLVGLALGVMRDAPAFPVFVRQRWGVLDNLVVAPAWRRRGVGARLVREIEKWAAGQGAKFTELGVYEFNDGARRFYEKLGYLPVLTKLRREH